AATRVFKKLIQGQINSLTWRIPRSFEFARLLSSAVADMPDHHDPLVLDYTEIDHVRLYRQGAHGIPEPRLLTLDHGPMQKDFQKIDGVKEARDHRRRVLR